MWKRWKPGAFRAAPGFVSLRLGGTGRGASPLPFAATQELRNARINASVGLRGHSTFVAAGRNVAVTRLRVDSDACNTVDNALTLAPCSAGDSAGRCGFRVLPGGAVRAVNRTPDPAEERCLELRPPAGPH
eukprot:gene28117-10921_t